MRMCATRTATRIHVCACRSPGPKHTPRVATRGLRSGLRPCSVPQLPATSYQLPAAGPHTFACATHGAVASLVHATSSAMLCCAVLPPGAAGRAQRGPWLPEARAAPGAARPRTALPHGALHTHTHAPGRRCARMRMQPCAWRRLPQHASCRWGRQAGSGWHPYIVLLRAGWLQGACLSKSAPNCCLLGQLRFAPSQACYRDLSVLSILNEQLMTRAKYTRGGAAHMPLLGRHGPAGCASAS